MKRLTKLVLMIGVGYLVGRHLQDVCPVSFQGDDSDYYPRRATKGAAGYDIYTPCDGVIKPGETKLIDLGWSVAVPKGWYVSLQTRSSLSVKKGIILANGTEGVVDCDYRDTVKLALRNTGTEDFHFKAGDRLAQLLFKRYGVGLPLPRSWFDLRSNDRLGGFGSTGIG